MSGTPAQPKITLKSDPELPQDEILARVLFNKSTGGLSIGEAAQLASAAAALASGRTGRAGQLAYRGRSRPPYARQFGRRGRTGTVEAGRNISENVYVGVEQGTSAASTVVEVSITDNLKLRSTTSSKAAVGRGALAMGLLTPNRHPHLRSICGTAPSRCHRPDRYGQCVRYRCEDGQHRPPHCCCRPV